MPKQSNVAQNVRHSQQKAGGQGYVVAKSDHIGMVVKNVRMDPMLANRAEVLARDRASTFSQIARQALVTFLDQECPLHEGG